MELKLENSEKVVTGKHIKTKLLFSTQQPIKAWYGGIELRSERPCGRNFVLAKEDLFCEGILKQGTYIRERNLFITTSAVPTVPDRHFKYKVAADVTIREANKPEIQLSDENPLVVEPRLPEIPKGRPSEISMRGIKIFMASDIVAKGDEITLSYDIESYAGIKKLAFSLQKQASIRCACQSFRHVCRYINPIPAEALEEILVQNPDKGKVVFKTIKELEDTHDYFWRAQEMSSIPIMGDSVNWIINIKGGGKNGEMINFQLPVKILTPLAEKETMKEGSALFSDQIPDQDADDVLVRKIKLVKHGVKEGYPVFRLKNTSGKKLSGITVKIAGIRNELFEWGPWMEGFSDWHSQEEIELLYTKKGAPNDLTGYQLTIEANNSNEIKIPVTLAK
ncbi:MAG: hypothetical protein ACFFD4_03120 [Candidatus Odinarchaeota archaeon]